MKNMKNKIPQMLIYSRLIIGPIIILICILEIHNYKNITVLLLTIGLLTDIFDGIIARRLNVSTQILRRLDSTVDQIFFVSVIIAAYIQCPSFFKTNTLLISTLIAFEFLTYLVSYFKFRKEIATHTIGAKVWTLILFSTLIQIILQCNSVFLFNLCFWFGILTRLEIIAITLTLKKWTNDVPSIYHAFQLRKGQEINRHKMFNG